ncbi:hypothetical protein CRUP_009040, partial [Coryphaenoides rupestris]
MHLNGSWGTLCDTCWDEQLAAMVCSMLGCGGGEPEVYAHFESPLAHIKDGPLWFYRCQPEHTVLWECADHRGEYINNKHICFGSKAAGLVCNGFAPDRLHLSPELIGCVALSVLLVVVLTAFSVFCLCNHITTELMLQQSSGQPQHQQQQKKKYSNDYRESVSLVKMAAGVPAGTPGPQRPLIGSAENTLYQQSDSFESSETSSEEEIYEEPEDQKEDSPTAAPTNCYVDFDDPASFVVTGGNQRPPIAT